MPIEPSDMGDPKVGAMQLIQQLEGKVRDRNELLTDIAETLGVEWKPGDGAAELLGALDTIVADLKSCEKGENAVYDLLELGEGFRDYEHALGEIVVLKRPIEDIKSRLQTTFMMGAIGGMMTGIGITWLVGGMHGFHW